MTKLSYQRSGVLTEVDLKSQGLLPSQKRFERGPVVIVECIEKIPCNPCVAARPKNVIRIKGEIPNIPEVNFDICNGCSLCIAKRPGLAIFVVNKNYNKKEAATTLPYEFLPRPQKDDTVKALNRRGKFVCPARVEKVFEIA